MRQPRTNLRDSARWRDHAMTNTRMEVLMLLCENCHRPLTLRAPYFCPVCAYPPSMQELAEHVVQDILADAQPYVQVAQNVQVLQGWLEFQREVGQIVVEHAP